MDITDWLAALPPELDRQRALLERLVTAISGDVCWRWLMLSCSVAEGRGDALSDLDLGLGAAEEAWPQILEEVPGLVSGLGEQIDALHHRIPEWGDRPHRRTFVQYADGVQLDLVIMPDRGSRGVPPGTVVLYDPGGRLSGSYEPPILHADGKAVREWAFLGWTALADLAKYLRRGSLWEALERLHQARTEIWRLWAVGIDARYPAFGLTSVLDELNGHPPSGLDATVTRLDAAEILRAALACARLLDEVSKQAADVTTASVPDAMAAYVTAQLQGLDNRYPT